MKGGRIVETPKGRGITKNSDIPKLKGKSYKNDKIPVYLDSGEKVLISNNNIKVIGYYD